MKTIFILLFLTFTTLNAFCEKDTIIYYTKLGKVVDTKTNAQSYEQVKKMTEKISYLERYVNKENKWVYDGDDRKMKKLNDSTYLVFSKITSPTDTIFRIAKKLYSGYIIKDYQNKVLVSTGFSKMIIPLIKEGKWINYYRSTQKVRSEEVYVSNQMISTKRWKESGDKDIPDVFTISEVNPEFQGGSAKLTTYMSNKIRYPGKSDRRGEKGTVTVQFIVMEDGTITNVEILKGVSPSLDAESIRVVKSMPAWTPGTTNGKNVRVQLQIPFQYKLPKA